MGCGSSSGGGGGGGGGCGSSSGGSGGGGGGCGSSSSTAITSTEQTTAIINQAKADYVAAKTTYNNASNDIERAKAEVAMSTAHAIAESARAAAGWGTGGVDGSATDVFMTTNAPYGTTGYGGTSGYVEASGVISSSVCNYLPTTTMTVIDAKGNTTTTQVIVYEGRSYDPVTGASIHSIYDDSGVVSWTSTDSNVNGVYGNVTVILDVLNDEIRRSYSGSTNSSIPALPELPAAPGAILQQTKIDVNKFEYVYGIKELEINRNNNYKNCVYVSAPININAPIAQISLDASESHPLFTPPDAGNRAIAPRHTSIEYYVTFMEKPADKDWLPILPKSQSEVLNELLFIKNNAAWLRFPALITYPITVYKNGVALDPDEDWSISPTAQGIVFKGTDINADYTIDYTPDASNIDPYTLDVFSSELKPIRYLGTDGTAGEVFDCANYNCCVALSYPPYIDYGIINTTDNYDCNSSSYGPIKVYLEDGAIAIPSSKTTNSVFPYNPDYPSAICTKNMTDYPNRTHKALSAYDITTNDTTGKPNNMVFEYYQDGSKIYFTETFQKSSDINNMDVSHGHAKIRVCYDYLVSNIRVKIILRRTGITELVNLTPNVIDYTLSMTTL